MFQAGVVSTETSAQFLAAVLERVAHPIFVKDRQFRFVLLNQAFCRMVGRSREEMLGRTDYDFFPPRESDFFRAKDEEMFASGAPVAVDEEIITDAGGERHVLATTKVPLLDASGEVAYLVGIIHDITRLKRAEEALRQANEELERRVTERSAALAAAQEELMRGERLALLGQLAGGLAHQIRNPLASITNAGYLLQKALGGQAPTELTEPLAILLEEAWKANRIITALLDQARIRAPERQEFPVDALVEQALAAHPAPPGVEIERRLGEVPTVSIDAYQVREALGNLVRNAYDAMQRGGRLTLEAHRDEAKVVLAVSDTGPGIAPEQERQLFRPLVTTKPQGLGLGLTTARMLVENQGGSIEFVRGPGPGARFEIRLPVAAG